MAVEDLSEFQALPANAEEGSDDDSGMDSCLGLIE